MRMEQKMCKSKKCQRVLPDGYKHKYCENCMGKRAENMKKVGIGVLGVVGAIGTVGVMLANVIGNRDDGGEA